MSGLYIMLPIALGIGFLFLFLFVWSVRNGDMTDAEKNKYKVFEE